MQTVLQRTGDEMQRQLDKWNEQNHVSYYGYNVLHECHALGELPTAQHAKDLCDGLASGEIEGVLTWTDIFLEEVLEALEEAKHGDMDKLKEELIQCAAVALSWVQSIERNGK